MPDEAVNENVKIPDSKSEIAERTVVAPAYFLSLSVENFRCFKQKQTLDLSTGNEKPVRWTLILGENGVGKTTLLQLLAIMQPTQSKYPASWPPRSTTQMKILHSGIDEPEESDDQSLIQGRRSKISCLVTCGRSFNSTQQNYTCHLHYRLQKNRRGPLVAIISGSGGYKEVTNNSVFICYGYGANRRLGTTSLSDTPSADTAASLFSDTAELLNAEEWLLQADYAVTRSKGVERTRAETRFNQVKNILIELLPDVGDLRITTSSASRMSAQVQAKTPYGWVAIQSLSLGYRALLTWMVDLAARLFERYSNSKNPLAEPAVVLVDEIDLHLHPRWQRTLIQFLSDTFPNTQFIATAHSPLVVQAASDANIVLLRREGDHVVIENDVEAIKGWRIDQVLTSDLFGLQSARPPQLDAALKERERILGKSRLTKADKAKLVQLEKEIGELPTGETPADIEAMDIIRQAAGLLK